MTLFNHVQIKVSDLKSAHAFYDHVMAALGHTVVLEIPGVVIGYGPHTHNMFEIRQGNGDCPMSQHVHIAFQAPHKESVDSFYTHALSKGATCNGPPGLRPHYGAHYYAAFVIDPEGHNIEAVCLLQSEPRRLSPAFDTSTCAQ